MPHRFRLNPAARLHLETTSAGCPVVIVDDFYADPMGVRELALQSRYDSSVAYYPGLHSGIDPNELLPMFEGICRLVTLLSDVTCSPQDIVSDFSVVTTRARDMLAMQKHPHVDPVDMAGIVYLNPSLEVGTSMFRHLPLG